MMKNILLVLIILISLKGVSQVSHGDNSISESVNKENEHLEIGGYAQIDFNQPVSNDRIHNGKLDVHRLVLLFNYKFSKKLEFVSEIEYEHVKEVYVEQAYVKYRFNNYLDVKVGLLLIPFGIINEYHEPTTYFGVERPVIDNILVPTTWRESGIGISGNIYDISLKYQLYLVNGFKSYDEGPLFYGVSGFRKGRQKGAKSIINSPNLSAKITHYGIRGLKIGMSLYTGKSQSTLFNDIDVNDDEMIAIADSSIVNIMMSDIDFQFGYKGLIIKGQFVYISNSNTEEYNKFTNSDIGEEMVGYYIEAGYDIFRLFNFKSNLIPFVRIEQYNTHYSVADGIDINENYNANIITTGVNWKINDGVVLKVDYTKLKLEATNSSTNSINCGVGISF